MASGNPLLAVHYSGENVIRTYELISGNFVLLGSNPLNFSTSITPRNSLGLSWLDESKRLLLINGSGGRIFTITYDLTGGNSVQMSNSFLSSTSSMSYVVGFAPGNNQAVFASSVSTPDFQNALVDISGTTLIGRPQISNPPSGPNSTGISYYGDVIATLTTGTSHFLYNRSTATNYTRTAFTTMEGTSASWMTYNGGHLIVRNANSTKLSIYRINGTSVTFVADFLTVTSGVINSVAIARNTKDIYVSVTSSGVTSTIRFQRYGDYPVQKETFNNFGTGLSVTGDGLNLIDALSKKMYSFNGTSWVANDAAMTAITAAGTTQILSSHVFQQITETAIYDGGLGTLIENGTTDDFRLHLLDSTAPTFDPTNATVDQATNNSASIVRSGNLPFTGINLPTFSVEYAGNRFRIVSDPVKHPVVDTFIEARYALLYNHTTGKPILRFDFGVNRIIPVGVYLTLSFLNDNVIVID